jgi:hypothetical protein
MGRQLGDLIAQPVELCRTIVGDNTNRTVSFHVAPFVGATLHLDFGATWLASGRLFRQLTPFCRLAIRNAHHAPDAAA